MFFFILDNVHDITCKRMSYHKSLFKCACASLRSFPLSYDPIKIEDTLDRAMTSMGLFDPQVVVKSKSVWPAL